MSDATFAVFRSVDDLFNQMDDNEKVTDDDEQEDLSHLNFD